MGKWRNVTDTFPEDNRMAEQEKDYLVITK